MSTGKQKVKLKRGYIALISAIIISVIVLLLVSSLSFMGFFGRFDILDAEAKERSSALAEACVDFAIVKLVEDDTYGGGEIKTVGDDSCFIMAVTTNAGVTTIETKAFFKDSYTNLRVLATPPLYAFTSWTELPNF